MKLLRRASDPAILGDHGAFYDFGGGEWPREEASHVIDEIQEQDYRANEEEAETNPKKYIQHDLNESLKLKPGSGLSASKVFRYITNKSVFLENIDNALLPSATLVLFDDEPSLNFLVEGLTERGYTIIQPMELVNPEFEGSPAEYEVTLRKPSK